MKPLAYKTLIKNLEADYGNLSQFEKKLVERKP